MTRIGLLSIAQRVSDIIVEARTARKGDVTTRRRIAAYSMPLLYESVEVGMQQSIIAIDDLRASLGETADKRVIDGLNQAIDAIDRRMKNIMSEVSR